MTSSTDRAVLANGAAVRCLDLNDAYFGVEPLHPSDIIPAVTATAEAEGASGEAYLKAILVGYDVAISLADVLPLRAVGLDHVNITAIGACAAIASLLGLPSKEAYNALALTLVPHAALRETRSGHLTMWKSLAAADATRHAQYACELAKFGVVGPSLPFSGDHGLLKRVQMEPEEAQTKLLTSLERARYRSRICDSHLKRWGLGYVAQGAVEAAERIFERKPQSLELVSVDITTFQEAIDLMDSPQKRAPMTPETADHSLAFVVCEMLRFGSIDDRTFANSKIQDSDLHRFLRTSVRIGADPEMTSRYPGAQPVTIAASFSDGSVISETLDAPMGHASRPMTDDQVYQKYIANAQPALGERRAEAFCAQVEQLDEASDIREATTYLAMASR